MPAASIRLDVVARLIELLRAEPTLQGVHVSDGWADMDEQVFIGDIRGLSIERYMQSGRKTRKDEFAVDVHAIAGKPGHTNRAARARALVLIGALDNVLAAKPTLGSLPGVTHAALTSINGPDAVATDEGYGGFADATVEILSRLT